MMYLAVIQTSYLFRCIPDLCSIDHPRSSIQIRLADHIGSNLKPVWIFNRKLPCNSHEFQRNCSLIFRIKLFQKKLRTDCKTTLLNMHTEHLRDHGKHIPACSAGQIMIKSSSVLAEILRDARIDPTRLEIH